VNERQLYEEIQTILQAATWTGGAEKIFHANGVMITAYTEPAEALRRSPAPLAIIRPGAATVDPEGNEEPGLIAQDFVITLVCRNPNDGIGQAALLGGASPDLQTTSENRGLLEVQEELFSKAKILDTVSGVTIFSRAKSAADGVIDDQYGYVVWRDYSFEALIADEAE
jgi:hypothetical protein